MTSATVLLVESDKASAPSYTSVLEKRGYTLTVTHSASEALAKVNGSMPDIIVVDAASLKKKLGGDEGLMAHFLGRQPTTAEIGYFLADWVRRTRSKSIDPIVIRDNWTGAYHFVAGPAIGQLNSYAKANDPFANVGTQAINVEIVSVLARSPSTYQEQWRETQFNAGTSGVTENWTGLFTAKINPPKNEAELRANPLGIFITAFQWSREL